MQQAKLSMSLSSRDSGLQSTCIQPRALDPWCVVSRNSVRGRLQSSEESVGRHVFFAVGLALTFAGWKMTGKLEGLGLMLVGIVLLLTALFLYNAAYKN